MPITLPTDMLALITGLPACGMVAKGNDRRSRHRVPLPVRALFWPHGDGAGGGVAGPGIEVSAQDISVSGISITGPVVLAPGDEFVVELGGAGGPPIKLRYQTVRAQPLGENLHLIAAAFQGQYVAVQAQAAVRQRRGFWSCLVPGRVA